MNRRLAVTVALVPLAAVAAWLAPSLRAASAPPEEAPPPAASSSVGIHATVTVDREHVLATDRTARLRLELTADRGDVVVVPTDLVVVLDRSGSMSGDKILDARATVRALADHLGPEDRVALVSFGSDVRLDWALAPVRPGFEQAVDAIHASGGTAMHLGLEHGLAQLAPTPGRTRRVVLVSDGLPNDRAPLPAIAARAARAEAPLTTIGIGLDYDEALMQSLADAGTGNFHWVRRGPDLGRVLADELATARETVAQNVTVRLRGATLVEAAGYPVAGDTVAIGTLFAGQRRSLWLTVRAPEGEGTVDLGSLDVTFTTPAGQRAELVADAPTVAVTHDPAVAWAALGDAWAASVVENDWNRLKLELSAAVQQGDRDAAVRAIDGYRASNEALNAFAKNPIVTDNLRDLYDLERQVEGNFVGDDQRNRQNGWAKTIRVDGYLGSRAGQVRGPVEPQVTSPGR